MSADVQGIYKAHFTGSLVQRVSRALKPISREDAQDLSLILLHVPTVDSISFAGNHLDARSLEVILPALTQLPRLTKLRISQNELMDEGVAALAKVIGKLVALQDLLLDENHFGDRGAKRLAEALPLCLVLVHVDISKNVVSLEGIHAVIAGAERCPSLKWVKVAFNRFDAASLLQSNFAFELLTK